MPVRGTPGQMGVGCQQELVMFNGTYDRAARADRYRKVAVEYAGLSEAAADPFLGSYYLRIAEDYQDQSQRELWAAARTDRCTGHRRRHAQPTAAAQPSQLAAGEFVVVLAQRFGVGRTTLYRM
jgi:hypothetical protein